MKHKWFRFTLVFLIIFSWVFSGWPQIGFRIQDSEFRIPFEIFNVKADTATSTYNFATTEEGWTGNAGNFTTDSYQAGAGNPAGALQSRIAGKSKVNSAAGWLLTGVTWESLGVPAGAVVTAVDASYDWSCSQYSTGASSNSGNLTVTDSGDGNSTILESGVAFTSTTSWATRNAEAAVAIPSAIQTSNSGIKIKLLGSLVTGNSLSAAVAKQLDSVVLTITYTPPSAPTVTTQAASSTEATTALCNGTITATGGVNATNAGCEWDIDSGAPYANTASTTGDYGVASFNQSLAGLPSGTTIYMRAFATNSAGTGYGGEVNTLTKPAAPTNVAATDGTYTDKVTITWTKSTGATDYHVWRDAVDLGSAGDVATFDDTGASAPTITAGSAVATDGDNTAQVDLSLSGASANNGTTYAYKVVASNGSGDSADSATDNGYRGVGALTYQWQRSAGDSDATYSDVSGATGSTYSDIAAPTSTITAGTASSTDGTFADKVVLTVDGASANNGEGRYYKVVLDATGASQQTSAPDRGYRGVGSLTYQWQRSAGDSDAGYSNIDGATTASYDDTNAPADGSGRYYKVIESATGATSQTSSADRGYRTAGTVSCSSNIALTDFGTLTDSGIATASPNASTTMSCSYAAGCTLYVKDAGSGSQAGLYKSLSPAYTIVSGTVGLSAGTDGYGIQAATSTAGSGGTLSLSATYLKIGNNVGGLSLTDVILASSSEAITNREVIVTHKASIAGAVTAGSYSDTITYSCIGN